MFYVYTLADPRDGSVFYVGKGKGNRIEAHEREARKGKQSAKCDRIRDIWEAGLEVVKTEVKHFESEVEAYQYEAVLIGSMKDDLTNIAPGGGGIRFHDDPPSVAVAKVSLAILSKIIAPDPRRPIHWALHKAMADGRADQWFREHWDTVDREAVRKELRKRNIDLVISEPNHSETDEKQPQPCHSNPDNRATQAVALS